MNNLVEIFKQYKENNKISHAYLINNSNYETIKNDLELIINNYINNENINIDNNINVKIVKREIDPNSKKYKTNITKNQIKELLNDISITSCNGKNIIYIIDGAEYLHLSASNALLKTLEEPEEGIYAFLLTNDINSIIATIKSRCIILDYTENEINNNVERSQLEELQDVLDNRLRIDNKELFNKLGKLDKSLIIKMLKQLLEFYKECLNCKILKIDYKDNKYNNMIEKNKDNIDVLTKKILILNKEIDKLNTNININLFIDNLIISFERC